MNQKNETSLSKGKYSQGFKILFRYLKRYQKTLAYLSILSVFSAIANSAIPYLSGRIIDSLISGQAAFLLLVILWLGVRLINDTSNWIIGVKSEHLEVNIDADYISAGVSKILDFPLKFHKSRKMGEIFVREHIYQSPKEIKRKYSKTAYAQISEPHKTNIWVKYFKSTKRAISEKDLKNIKVPELWLGYKIPLNKIKITKA